MRSFISAVLFLAVVANVAVSEERNPIQKAGEYAAIIMNHPENQAAIDSYNQIALNLQNQFDTLSEEQQKVAAEVLSFKAELGI